MEDLIALPKVLSRWISQLTEETCHLLVGCEQCHYSYWSVLIAKDPAEQFHSDNLIVGQLDVSLCNQKDSADLCVDVEDL